jgi:hypothetical protein
MKLTILDEGIIWKNPYPSARAQVGFHGHTVNLGGGELLHAMRVGQAKASRDGGCRIFRSQDHGKTWSETTPLIANGDQDSTFGYFTAIPRRTGDGTLWAVSIRFRLADPEDPRYTADNGGWLNAESFFCRSTDRGHTWSKPQYLHPENPSGGFHNAATGVIELDSRELMILFEPFFTDSLQKLRHEVVGLYSRDHGQTWGDQTVVARDTQDRLIYFDPRPAQLPDSRWVCLFWTHEKQTDKTLNTTVAWSDDGPPLERAGVHGAMGIPYAAVGTSGRPALCRLQLSAQPPRCSLRAQRGRRPNLEHGKGARPLGSVRAARDGRTRRDRPGTELGRQLHGGNVHLGLRRARPNAAGRWIGARNLLCYPTGSCDTPALRPNSNRLKLTALTPQPPPRGLTLVRPELQQFSVQPRCAPEHVDGAHVADQVSDFLRDTRSSHPSPAALLVPVELESFRCQPMTVSGFTTMRVSRQFGQRQTRATHKNRSHSLSRTRLRLLRGERPVGVGVSGSQPGARHVFVASRSTRRAAISARHTWFMTVSAPSGEYNIFHLLWSFQ